MAGLRHELKHEISIGDAMALRCRLKAVAKLDFHAAGGSYEIRSLYFDNLWDMALREKLDGINRREKFRVRYYNRDTSLIHLEKKIKCNNLTGKESAELTALETQLIIDGDYDWMGRDDRPLVVQLYNKIRTQGLLPKTIVEYTREPFVYGPGNVRVTLDYNIRTGIGGTDFLNPDCITVPAGNTPVILEVKWDAYLPDIIRDAVQVPFCRANAYSKYAVSRIYG